MYSLREENGQLVYRDDRMHVIMTVPEGCTADFKQTASLPAMTEQAKVDERIENPATGEKLSVIAANKGAETACILVSDATRAVPTARMIPAVIHELEKGGVPLDGITCFVAIGVHRPATEEEMMNCLGEYAGKVAIENHTPFDEENLVMIGKTSRGTPVKVNKRAYECDIHVQIGKVEPHEFAGFSGGRKSVLPGVSSELTIITNHRPEMILHEKAAIGNLAGNPVHEDMIESAEWFGIDFSVNCILNQQLELAAVFAGTLHDCHAEAVNYVREFLGVPLKKPDIIVTTPGMPLGLDFYQSVKALIALTEVVDGDTTIVLTSECQEGVMSQDMLKGFDSGETVEEFVAWTKENYKIQMDHVLLLAKIMRKGTKIIVSSPNVSDEEIKLMHMIPEKDPQKALEMAINGRKDVHITFYPCPQTGLPVAADV